MSQPATLFDADDDRYCPECGQRWPTDKAHRMDYGKWKLLRDVAAMNAAGIEWVKVQRDGRLIKEPDQEIQADDVHALRLTWFGLLRRLARRSGKYQVTRLGIDFLGGNASVPERIWCRKGVVMRRSDRMVRVNDIKGLVLDKAYWDWYAATAGACA